MPEVKQNFLELYSQRRIKKEIQSICDSYSHPWDILAELLQNSVDSIKKWNREYGVKKKRTHFIDIKIDKKNKSIKINDSGTGIDLDKLPALLAPNVTDKDSDRELVGEKGVGLKFAIFSSNKFTLNTLSSKGSYNGEVNGARTWLHSAGEDTLLVEKVAVEKKIKDPTETFTEIELVGVGDAAEQIFKYTFDELVYILRSKTFVGYTGNIFKNENFDITVSLEVIDEAGKSVKAKVDFKYWLPSDFFDIKKDLADIDAYDKEASRLSDAQKAKRLAGRCLYSKQEITRGGKKFWYYAFFVPKREIWNEMAKKAKLEREENEEPLINHGIYVSTRGMPTGIEIVPPKSGSMGYWAQLFIIIEYDDFKFDIGRKTIPNREKSLLKEIAKEQFNRFNTLYPLISGKPPSSSLGPELERLKKDSRINELEKLPSLGLKEISFEKEPDGQEAAVIAIFHELIGAGIIKGYHGFKTAYKDAYDFWGRYIIDKTYLGKNVQAQITGDGLDIPIVIEFKADASSIIEDVTDRRKHFEELNLIVCWDIDTKEFAKERIQVEPIKPEDALYHGATHKLVWPGTYNLGNNSEKHLLVLRSFIDTYKRSKQ